VIEKLKICMIGATGVGKTSLVARFMNSIFRERYATTIGVMIAVKEVQRADERSKLILWDLSGEDEFQSVQSSYLRGAAGFLVVADGTRRATFDTALALETKARATTGDVPFVVAVNKSDLVASWEVDARMLETLKQRELNIIRTSAKTGVGVEEAFNQLVDAIYRRRGKSGWT
jgi:small GTP-binding protein